MKDHERELVVLREYAEKWQKRLNLSHWRIDVGFKPKDKKPKCHGTVKIHLSDDIAEILVIEPGDYDWVEPYDMEFILLHEMLHIAFEISPNKHDKLENIMFERGLNRVAKALLALDREGTST